MNRRNFLRTTLGSFALAAGGLYIPTRTFFLPPTRGWMTIPDLPEPPPSTFRITGYLVDVNGKHFTAVEEYPGQHTIEFDASIDIEPGDVILLHNSPLFKVGEELDAAHWKRFTEISSP